MATPIAVAQYYAGKSIFITGATGFMGTVLVEKLLRSCPDLKTLYLLMRAKKGLSAKERLQDYVKNEVFNKINSKSSKSLQKLRMIFGDLQEEHLGISIEDQEELQRECQIIFHCAASVRFDMFIRDAVDININGTLKVLRFAETMKKLEVFLHMSTAYCHDYLDVLEEKLYPAKHSPQDIMNIVKWMDDDMLKIIENKLIHPLPNTYSYTKELSEVLVSQFAGKFTIAIARPSIVTAVYREPLPGWIDNMNGPTGFLVGIAKGVIRVLQTRKDLKPDIIPGDIAINACILLTCVTGLEQPKDIRVCNITNSGLNTMSWATNSIVAYDYILKYPFSGCVWYPKITYHESRLLYQIHAFFVHWLPAVLIDALLLICRRKPFMLKVQTRIHHGSGLLSHYMTGDWIFKNDYFLSLRDKLTKEEREIFNTYYETENAEHYIRSYVEGTRRYLCKDPPSTLPQAKRQLKLLYYLHVALQTIFLWFFINFSYNFIKKLF